MSLAPENGIYLRFLNIGICLDSIGKSQTSHELRFSRPTPL